MKALSKQGYESMIDGAKIIESNNFGPSMLELTNGHYLKIFRRPRLFSTAIIWPYSLRFVRAAEQLEKRGLATVKVIERYTVWSLVQDMVEYEPLPGQTLRQRLEQAEDIEELLEKMAGFLAQIHQIGIYFRGLHFDNILVCSDGEFTLIDFARSRFSSRSLGPWRRARNFRLFRHYVEDIKPLESYGLARFVQTYLDQTQLSAAQRNRFLSTLGKLHLKWHQAVEQLTALSAEKTPDVSAKTELTS